jgi:hypothetical protein
MVGFSLLVFKRQAVPLDMLADFAQGNIFISLRLVFGSACLALSIRLRYPQGVR